MSFRFAQAVLLLAFAALHLVTDRALGFGPCLALHLLATAAYLVLAAGAARGRWTPSFAHALLLVAALRVLALPLAPSLSNDVHRNLFEGSVVRAGLNPYLTPPADPRAAHLRGPTWSEISYPELAAVYPPAVEYAFALAVTISDRPLGMKLVFGACDLLVFVALWRWLAGTGRAAPLAVWHGLCPLLALEFAGEGHNDSLAVLALVTALWASARARPVLAGVLLAVATAGKLLPLVLLPFVARRSWRAVPAFALALAALYLPFVGAGRQLLFATEEYVARWRSNDSLFAWIHALAERVAELPSVQALEEPWFKEAQRLAKYPLALLTLLLVGWGWFRRWAPERFARAFFLLFLAIAPCVHPWYLAFLLPWLAFAPNLWLGAFTGTVYLAYHLLPEYHRSGRWEENGWIKVVEYVPFYVGVLVELRRREVPRVAAGA